MRKDGKEEIMHIMKNIATKFKGVETMYENQCKLHEAQRYMIGSINTDWDRIWALVAKDNGNGKDNAVS